MKKYYMVSFKWSDTVYCANVAHAESEQVVKDHYSKYEWVNVRECDLKEVNSVKRKGMPIIEI